MPVIDYAMVTVKLGHDQVERSQAFAEIKQALALQSPIIDESFGAHPMGPNDQYVVLVDVALAQKMKAENHPNVVGVFVSPKKGVKTPPAQQGQGL